MLTPAPDLSIMDQFLSLSLCCKHTVQFLVKSLTQTHSEIMPGLQHKSSALHATVEQVLVGLFYLPRLYQALS